MYAPATFWDAVYLRRNTTYGDEDGQGFWALQWLPILEKSGSRKVLDLGCGVGVDCLTLAQHELEVVGLDYSHEAITRAQAHLQDPSLPVRFLQADMASPLPFPDQEFDAVMSNVAFHSFPDRLLRSILGEIRRILRQDGLVLLHVNSLEDMHYRPKDRAQEIEPDYYLESDGQTMHFFSETYCRDLFQMWDLIDLTHLHYPPRGRWVDKCVWRVVAQKV
jgi:ubiquinone/menaquinone biosynthesis C-methylase UbiE